MLFEDNAQAVTKVAYLECAKVRAQDVWGTEVPRGLFCSSKGKAPV